MKIYTKEHPECQEDEIHLGNMTKKDYQNVGYKTKRCGRLSYTVEGNPFPYQKEHDVHPVFVKEWEFNRVRHEQM